MASTFHDPLEQFNIKLLSDPISLAGYDVSFTNSSLMMVLTVAAVTLFMTIGMSKRALIPGRWQSLSEISYEFIANMIKDNVGSAGRKFFPFVFTLFMFILFANLLGLLPYSFTFTSHIAVTFTLAFVVFLGVTLVGFAKHGAHFLSFFVPGDVPKLMLVLLVPIEILSYLSRPLSLSIRLFANMMAGHAMMKVFAGFVAMLGVFGIFPLGVDVLLTAFELLVAFLQAYVFTVLTCLYLNDAIHLH